jgi:hypothetical protein
VLQARLIIQTEEHARAQASVASRGRCGSTFYSGDPLNQPDQRNNIEVAHFVWSLEALSERTPSVLPSIWDVLFRLDALRQRQEILPIFTGLNFGSRVALPAADDIKPDICSPTGGWRPPPRGFSRTALPHLLPEPLTVQPCCSLLP